MQAWRFFQAWCVWMVELFWRWWVLMMSRVMLDSLIACVIEREKIRSLCFCWFGVNR